ncbi:hypothetical protein A3J17_05315 [Candidatus Curtissbacteria bacterium RIFCSPLOWO2_02_FULL_40_11]|uniref:Uncharacterized protein n=2 Tax=Candidatus Curtissiibacteriota TaxID=1752717 RepID=A0A1F5G8W9_9BACT|nr:MAG: hypothetical protein A3D04_00710 [Candidatus Curtissbacteria bacterium RIFCSPHIGHO2_02_FULL_40_16b]OGE00075.1 MAG: hypothetical protein A3J17_05315 [Candidatus Curtissbacteria bacterium RIFCSPLOWO2_02_FULL_40_11]
MIILSTEIMPFKSKKKKIRAKERRITLSEEGLALYKSGNTIYEGKEENQKPTTVKKTFESSKNYTFVSGEILRILALASLIIGLQFFLRLSNITF